MAKVYAPGTCRDCAYTHKQLRKGQKAGVTHEIITKDGGQGIRQGEMIMVKSPVPGVIESFGNAIQSFAFAFD